MRTIRTVIVIMIVALLPTIIIASGEGNKVGDIKVTVTVRENIIISKETIVVSMFPGETEEREVELENKASVDSAITLTLTIDPDNQGVIATIAKDVVVPANGSTTRTVTIKARNNAVLDKYEVTIGVYRK